MTEAELDAEIQKLCKPLGIYSYHPAISIGSELGWPDRTYLGHHGCLFRELKSAGGTLTHHQRMVGYRMTAVHLDWAVWRPSDFKSGRIQRELGAVALQGLPGRGGTSVPDSARRLLAAILEPYRGGLA